MPDGQFKDEHPQPGEHVRWNSEWAREATAMWLLPQRPGVNNITLVKRGPGYFQFYRRHSIEINMSAGSQRPLGTITVVGIEQAAGVGQYLYAFEDGSVLMADDLHVV